MIGAIQLGMAALAGGIAFTTWKEYSKTHGEEEMVPLGFDHVSGALPTSLGNPSSIVIHDSDITPAYDNLRRKEENLIALDNDLFKRDDYAKDYDAHVDTIIGDKNHFTFNPYTMGYTKVIPAKVNFKDAGVMYTTHTDMTEHTSNYLGEEHFRPLDLLQNKA